jgi:predicted MFS family arabinose efflux permease/quinol monooxygenase YgiN
MAESHGSAWLPLRNGTFRVLWLAVFASNVGLWMQTVGAQWLLVHRAQAAILVPLVQVADMLPDLLFGLVGGVFADIFDRRRLLIVVQLLMAGVCTTLTVLTKAGHMPPALLLAFTFALGTGSVLTGPAYQSLIPDLVPRSEIPAASSLGSVNINLARAIGPAIAGVLISLTGVSGVFALDAAALLLYALVVALWPIPSRGAGADPGPFLLALASGTRYVRYAPVVRRMLFRAALFLVPGSVLWALLPLIATERLGLGASGYGLLLGALGIGAVAGAFILPTLRATLAPNTLIAAASCVYALTLVVAVLTHVTAVTVAVLLPAGMAWMAFLSSVNAWLQLFLPAWVRARAISVYLMVLFGSQALGALLWGAVAAPAGLVATFLIAAGLMALGTATILFWPLIDTQKMGRDAAVYWPEPQLTSPVEADNGPVVVETTYTVTPQHQQAFLDAMAKVRLSRLRTGATNWGLFREGEAENVFVELFVVPSWQEHERQHDQRQTATDHTYEQQARALSETTPRISHLISTGIDRHGRIDFDA